MNLFALLSFIFACICFLSAWISFRFAGNLFSTVYSLFMLCTGYWQLCTGLTLIATTAEQAVLWSRLAYLGAIFLPMLLFELIHCSVGLRVPKKIHITLYIFTFLLLGLFLYSDQLLAGVHHYPWGYWFKAGPWHILFCLLYSFILVLFPIFLFWHSKKATDWTQRQRAYARRLAIAYFVANLGAIDFFPNYGMNVYPLGVFFAGICYYLLTRLFLEYDLFKVSD